MTVSEIRAARATRDYDGRYEATTWSWTTELFVEALYRDLERRR